MLNGRTELHIFDRWSVIGDRYCKEALLPHARLFRGAIDQDFIFMDDNARPHRTFAVEELRESEDITRMYWPAYSPDLNPIEHVWDALGRRIAARLHHPENTQQLKQMLIEEWALLPQEMLHQQVLSMRKRCEATIASDESRFQLNRADGNVWVWRQPHESMDTTCQQGTVQADEGSVMVWSVCSWRDMGPLIHLYTTLTGDRHTLSWPPKSPDMNFNEYIWDALQRAVQKRSPLPLTPTDLWTALQDSWCRLPPALLQTLIESIARRDMALPCARGGPTRY
ncbi:transposable element Tcb2 transposase [Trichonephila clavipes]|nr:transposable element Tcb2 transposase [Trichonephila clavipes]